MKISGAIKGNSLAAVAFNFFERLFAGDNNTQF